MDNSNEKHSNEAQTQPSCLGAVSGWVAVTDALPKALQTVWLTNGKGWVCLGCLVEDAEGWHWAESNGVIYIENGEIVSECESEDLDVNFWHELPKPPCPRTQRRWKSERNWDYYGKRKFDLQGLIEDEEEKLR